MINYLPHLELLRLQPSRAHKVSHKDRRQGGGRHLVLCLSCLYSVHVHVRDVDYRGAMEHVQEVFQQPTLRTGHQLNIKDQQPQLGIIESKY